MSSTNAQGIRWDLTDLYAGVDDPAIDADLADLNTRADAFERRYRGAVAEGRLDADGLYAAIAELEAISEGVGLLVSFADLTFSADTQTPSHGALATRMREAATDIRAKVLFFELEWTALDDDAAAPLLNHPKLAHYHHFLTRERAYRPHRRTEGEEVILSLKDNTGAQAFSRLFDETLARARFTCEQDGEAREMSEEEILSLLYHPDRATRKAAADGLTEGLDQMAPLLCYIFNTIVADHASDDKIRHYQGPMDARNLANEIPGASVDALLDAVDAANPTVHDYYRLKREILGLSELFDYDRYAPMGEGEPIPFDEARQMVLDAFGAFSPQMAEIAQKFFDHRWIDAEPREGKRGGAFSHSVVPSRHPYVLMNYLGRPRDVMTLAHELGHGVHQYLARKQGYFGGHTPLTTAETASVFGEMLVFQALKERQTDPGQTLALLCGKLEDTFATVFRQVVMTRFEQALHAARREEGELSDDRIGELWMAANTPMFGDALTLRDGYKGWWRYIPHFIHTPFYCYAYAYGELLVLALYARYLEEGRGFVPKYLEMLTCGGNDSPEAIMAKAGIDITAQGFWQGGLKVIAGWVSDARSAQENLAETR